MLTFALFVYLGDLFMDAIISGRCLLIQLNMKIKTVNLILLMVLFGPLRAIVE